MCPTKKPSKLVREFSASSESRFARSFVRTLVEGAYIRPTKNPDWESVLG